MYAMNPQAVLKYRAYTPIPLTDRTWPNRRIEQAPIWCSVDLRDGNQALIEPMGPDRKIMLFDLLVKLGFKEIEIGFPAASQTDFDFVRFLIEHDRVPGDVTLQVLTQAREDLIERTFAAIEGAPRAIVHLYNSTSELQRRVVFQLDRPGIIEIARRGTGWIKQRAAHAPGEITLQYSPESFTGTEPDFAIEICEAVADIWGPTADKRMIVNLPATVEMAPPNVYADQIEYFNRHVRQRERLILSLHPHNDRGTGVAAAELALMAGADRVEGTLFGNGERTGNVDIVTMGLNMFTQGVNPELDLSNVNEIVRMVEHCNQIPVHPRHPYGGELVFTAFSGSHQDAINKGFTARRQANSDLWEVPYLPIDPRDIGRSYDAVIRINSQSGKGGLAYIMRTEYGIDMPRRLQVEFAQVVQREADATGRELDAAALWRLFAAEYLDTAGRLGIIDVDQQRLVKGGERIRLSGRVRVDRVEHPLEGVGNGPIDAFFHGLQKIGIHGLRLVDYREHAVTGGADATAVSFVELIDAAERTWFGVGMHKNIVTASLEAVVSALNRAARARA